MKIIQINTVNNTDNMPRTYAEALKRPDKDKFTECTEKEFNSLNKMKVYDTVPIPKNQRLLKTKIVYKIKSDGRYSS